MKKLFQLFLSAILFAGIFAFNSADAQITLTSSVTSVPAGGQFILDLQFTYDAACGTPSLTFNLPANIHVAPPQSQPFHPWGPSILGLTNAVQITFQNFPTTGSQTLNFQLNVEMDRCIFLCINTNFIFTAIFNTTVCQPPQISNQIIVTGLAETGIVISAAPVQGGNNCAGGYRFYDIMIFSGFNMTNPTITFNTNGATVFGVGSLNVFGIVTGLISFQQGSGNSITFNTGNFACYTQKLFRVGVSYPCDFGSTTGLTGVHNISLSGTNPCQTTPFQCTVPFSLSPTSCCDPGSGQPSLIQKRLLSDAWLCPGTCNASMYELTFGNVFTTSGYNNVKIEDAIPDQINVTNIYSDVNSQYAYGQVDMYYQIDNVTTWLGPIPITSGGSSPISVPALMPGSFLSRIKWVYASIPLGKVITNRLEFFVINPDRYGNPVIPGTGPSLGTEIKNTMTCLTLSPPFTGSVEAKNNVKNCPVSLYTKKMVNGILNTSLSTSADPGDIVTFRLKSWNAGSTDVSNVTISDVLNPYLEFIPSSERYYYGTNPAQPFGLPDDLSAYNATSPLTGPLTALDIISPTALSMNIPTLEGTGCIAANQKYLIIEFQVRVKDIAPWGSKVNYYELNETSSGTITSNNATVTVNKRLSAETFMYVKCPSNPDWVSSANAKAGDVVQYSYKVKNTGTISIDNIILVNIKPMPGDFKVVNFTVARNSQYKIDYECNVPPVTIPASASPGLTLSYDVQGNNLCRSDLNVVDPPGCTGPCPPGCTSPSWTGVCNTNNSNNLKITLPPLFVLLPGDEVDVILQGRVSSTASVGDHAFNSFGMIGTRTDFNIQIVAVESSNLAEVIIDNTGCPEPDVSIDGSIDINPSISAIADCIIPVNVCGNFSLPAQGGVTGTLQSIALSICHNGAVVATLTNPVLTGNQYCFTLNASDFPAVTAPADGYDFVTTADFMINNSSITQTSSTLGNGIIPNQNNDFKLICNSLCDSYSASAIRNNIGDCCWVLDLTHPSNTAGVTGIQFLPLTPNSFVPSSYSPGAAYSSGWVFGPNLTTNFTMRKPSGVPTGPLPGFLNFCMNKLSSPQYLVVNWLNSTNDIVCADTVELNCEIPCITYTSDTIICTSNNNFSVSFDFKNNSNFTISQIESSVISPTGVTLSPSPVILSTPVAPTQNSGTITLDLNGATPNTNLCIKMKFISDDGCCWCFDTLCVTVPACICNEVGASITGDPNSCCYDLNLVNNYSANYFDQVNLTILTPGVIFNSFTTLNNANDWYSANVLPPNQIQLIKFPVTGQIPFPTGNLNNIMNFCLSGYTTAPTVILVDWMKNDSVKCTDTLIITCNPPSEGDTCGVIFNDTLICLPDGTYEYQFQVSNNSDNATTGFMLDPVLPSGLTTNPSPADFPNVPILPHTVSPMQSLIISGVPTGSTTICFQLALYVHTQGYAWCCHADTTCIQIPDCGGDSCSCGHIEIDSIRIKNNNNNILRGPCGTTFTGSVNNSYAIVAPSYVCTGNCTSTMTNKVFRNGTLMSSGAGAAYVTPNPAGLWEVRYYFYCGGTLCDSCNFYINSDDIPNDSCECGNWKTDFASVIINNQPSINVGCGGTVNAQLNQNLTVNFPTYVCPDVSCMPQYTWDLSGGSGTIPVHASGTGSSVNYTFNAPGTYNLSLIVYCGGKACDTCLIRIIIKGGHGCDSAIACFTSQDTVCDNAPFVIDGSCSQNETDYFLSVQESDIYWNRFGIEQMEWFPGMAPGSIDIKAWYLSKGAQFVCNKYYRVKLAVKNSCTDWHDFTKLIYVKCCDSGCECGKWTEDNEGFTIHGFNGNADKEIETLVPCGKTYNSIFLGVALDLVSPEYNCSGKDCKTSYDWIIMPPTGTSAVFNSFVINNFVFNKLGTYSINLKVSCGGKVCDSCISYIKVINPPPKVNDCKFTSRSLKVNCIEKPQSKNPQYNFSFDLVNGSEEKNCTIVSWISPEGRVMKLSPVSLTKGTSSVKGTFEDLVQSGTFCLNLQIKSASKPDVCQLEVCFESPKCKPDTSFRGENFEKNLQLLTGNWLWFGSIDKRFKKENQSASVSQDFMHYSKDVWIRNYSWNEKLRYRSLNLYF